MKLSCRQLLCTLLTNYATRNISMIVAIKDNIDPDVLIVDVASFWEVVPLTVPVEDPAIGAAVDTTPGTSRFKHILQIMW